MVPFFSNLGISEITTGKIQEYRVHGHQEAIANRGKLPVWVLKTLCIWKYNDLATGDTQQFDMILVMIVWLRHLLGWLVSAFHSR